MFLKAYSPDQWWYTFPQKFKKLPVNKFPQNVKELMEKYPDFKVSIVKYKTKNNVFYQCKENKKETIAMLVAGMFFILIVLLGIIKFADIVIFLTKIIFDKYFL